MAGEPLDRVLLGCERLRRLPQQRWQMPPIAPLGTRLPHQVPETTGAVLEVQVRLLLGLLMDEDAAARGVATFAPDVSCFALPDVLAALARSVAQRDPESRALAVTAATMRAW